MTGPAVTGYRGERGGTTVSGLGACSAPGPRDSEEGVLPLVLKVGQEPGCAWP